MADMDMSQPQGLLGWLRGKGLLQKITLLFLLLLLFGGAAGQAYLGYQLFQGKGRVSFSSPNSPVIIDKEKKVLEETEREFRQIMLYRKHSREYAGVILAIAREPYGPDLPRKTAAYSAASAAEPELEVLPPYMAVRAVFIVGNRKTAIMDVENEASGLIVQEGTSIGGGLGKILKISRNGVVVRWSGKNISVSLEE